MKKLVRIGMLVVFIAFGQTLPGNAQEVNHVIEPKGTYKEIDVARHNEAIYNLSKGSEQQKKQTTNAIMKNPNYYNPPVIYALSRVLFEQGKKDEAAYWFYLAQLRARYDANLCMDKSARQGVTILNMEYGQEINKYALQDIPKLKIMVNKVVEFVRKNNENYDHRWLNLHGMGAVTAGLDEYGHETDGLSAPVEKWPEIKKKTVDDYYNGFVEAMKSLKK